MSENVTVGTSLARITHVEVQQAEVVAVQIKNNGAAALNAFQLRGRSGDGSHGFLTLQSSGFTTSGIHCIYASSEPGVLASGAECILYLTPGYLRDIELWASTASGTADITISATRMEG